MKIVKSTQYQTNIGGNLGFSYMLVSNGNHPKMKESRRQELLVWPPWLEQIELPGLAIGFVFVLPLPLFVVQQRCAYVYAHAFTNSNVMRVVCYDVNVWYKRCNNPKMLYTFGGEFLIVVYQHIINLKQHLIIMVATNFFQTLFRHWFHSLIDGSLNDPQRNESPSALQNNVQKNEESKNKSAKARKEQTN